VERRRRRHADGQLCGLGGDRDDVDRDRDARTSRVGRGDVERVVDQRRTTWVVSDPRSFAELVNKPSTQCGAMKLVDPGAPERSYLVLKLAPTGTGCFQGTRMPKADSALTPDEIQRVRDWIANGAPNN
jgi:hypothetical protein